MDAFDEEFQNTVRSFMDQESCSTLAFFDLVKALFLSKSVPISEKKRVAQALRARFSRDGEPQSLIESMVTLGLLKIAVEERALTVSDPMYLRLGAISAEGRRAIDRARFEPTRDEAACFEKKKSNCETSLYRRFYESMRQESLEARILSEELSWWAKRAR